MKKIKQIDKNETNNMNIINEIQNNTKQWNHDLNCSQNQTPTESITKLSNNNCIYWKFSMDLYKTCMVYETCPKVMDSMVHKPILYLICNIFVEMPHDNI
jgi:hypothetical protein